MVDLMSFLVIILFLTIVPQLIIRHITKKKKFNIKIFGTSCVLFILFILWLPKQPKEEVKINSYNLYPVNNEYLKLDSETQISRLDSVTYKEYEYYIKVGNEIKPCIAYRSSSNIYKTNGNSYVDIYRYNYKNHILEKFFGRTKYYYDINRWDFYINQKY